MLKINKELYAIRTHLYSALIDVLFVVKYERHKDKRGYFLRKRKWLWLLLSPGLILVYVFGQFLYSFVHVYSDIFSKPTNHWICNEERILNRDQRLDYKIRLFD